jgi:hypothetical protein
MSAINVKLKERLALKEPRKQKNSSEKGLFCHYFVQQARAKFRPDLANWVAHIITRSQLNDVFNKLGIQSCNAFC